jgi:riboflavin kinase/FMN adenylyltransferase
LVRVHRSNTWNSRLSPLTTPRTKPFVVVRDDLKDIAVRDAAARALSHPVVAIGNFDGVHRGHQVVIGHAMALAARLGRPAAALTFEPSPRSYFRPDEPTFRIASAESKLRLFAATGLDGAFVLTFGATLAGLEAEEFISHLLIERLGISGAVVGFDFHFGHNRSGDPEFLTAEGARRGFAVDVVPAVSDSTRRFSSGAVRTALASGDVADAAEILGYPWFISGAVIHGEKRGRDLGFPTANIRLEPSCGLRHGIYAVRVAVGDRRIGGVASFGRRPTFDNGAPLLEIFLFDFSGDLYGKILDVAFLGWIRPEEKFISVEALKTRMDDDAAQARAILAASGDAFPPLAPLPDLERP